jgi:hypothetical protein
MYLDDHSRMHMDDENLQELKEYTSIVYLIFYTMMMVISDTHNLLNSNALDKGCQQLSATT